MNIFEYVPLMAEMNSVASIIGAAILVLFLLIVIFKMIGGIRQGFWRQLIRTGRFVAAGIISFIIASGISGAIVGMFNEDTFNDLLAKVESMGVPVTDSVRTIISCFNPDTFEYLLLLPAAVILVPLAFTLLFILINTILKIVSAITINILGLKKASSSPSRLGGAVLAGVEAVLLFTILFLPVTGALSIVDDVYEVAFEAEENQDNEDIVNQYETIMVPFVENPAFKFTGSLGGNALSKAFATVKVEGEKIDARRDITEIIHIILIDGPALKGADFNNLTEENKAAIDSIINSVGDSPFLSGILVGLVQGMGNAMGSDILPVDFGEFSDVMDGVVEYLTGFSTATFSEDLHTIVNVYYAISDSGVLKAMKESDSNIMDLLEQKRKEGDDVLSRIVEILKENKRTSKLITAMTKALISNLVQNNPTIPGPNGEKIEVSYDTVKDSVSDILNVNKDEYETEEKFKEELGNTLDKALEENNIKIEQEVINGIVDHINENYDEIYSVVGEVEGELTDEQFNDILLQYYTSYLNSQGNQTPGGEQIPGGEQTPSGEQIPGGLDGILDSLGGLGGLEELLPSN